MQLRSRFTIGTFRPENFVPQPLVQCVVFTPVLSPQAGHSYRMLKLQSMFDQCLMAPPLQYQWP